MTDNDKSVINEIYQVVPIVFSVIIYYIHLRNFIIRIMQENVK